MAGQFALAPGRDGAIERVIAVIKDTPDIWCLSHLPGQLPEGSYRLTTDYPAPEASLFAASWLLGGYHFSKYKKPSKRYAKLATPVHADTAFAQQLANSIFLVRDLINTPANDMHPEALAQAAAHVAKEHKAKCAIIAGESLLSANYPAIYTVGKASATAPRLVDIRWGESKHPRVTLVGKGVCFDTGGLDIKSSSNMKLMKKDMGGAAVVLGLAQLVMAQKLPVCLRVLLPIVENAVSGNAMRPTDIIPTRKGLTVEIGNTDAEGRLILADALTEADSEKPDLLIDCATLTGAARVALGAEIPAFFTPDDKLAQEISHHSAVEADPLFRLPLWENYREMLDSKIADLSNDPESGYGGAITAALFLKEFVRQTKSWMHIDMMAWNASAKPGRPVGGEAQGLRALFALLQARYG